MAEAPRFSLVVATLGRVEELRPLFASLAAQGASLEVILVDQNPDDRLVPVVAAFSPALPIRHLRAEVRNSSYARNVGLPHCSGEIVGFPDDDCVYPPGTLAFVDRAFADLGLGVLTGPAASPEGGLGSGRWETARGPISWHNAFTTVICFNLFLRRDLLARIGGFDEALGVGAEFGACEENDLVIRAFRAGAAALYEPALRVVHPDKRLTPTALARAFRYGAGFGYVLRKHGFPLATLARFLLRPVGGALLAGLRGQWLQCAYYRETLRGRIYGWRRGKRATSEMRSAPVSA